MAVTSTGDPGGGATASGQRWGSWGPVVFLQLRHRQASAAVPAVVPASPVVLKLWAMCDCLQFRGDGGLVMVR